MQSYFLHSNEEIHSPAAESGMSGKQGVIPSFEEVVVC